MDVSRWGYSQNPWDSTRRLRRRRSRNRRGSLGDSLSQQETIRWRMSWIRSQLRTDSSRLPENHLTRRWPGVDPPRRDGAGSWWEMTFDCETWWNGEGYAAALKNNSLVGKWPLRRFLKCSSDRNEWWPPTFPSMSNYGQFRRCNLTS